MPSSAYKIVVWERSNKLGKWCPYSAKVCQFLEDRRKDTETVCLGDVDEELKIYYVNLKELVQVSEKTGTRLSVRRCLYDKVCVLGRGFLWQWLDDHDVWNTYDADINDYIDTAYLEGKKSISLNKKFPSYNYEIIFSKLLQINKHSKRKRRIRRQESSSPYPIVNCEEEDQDMDTKETDDVNEIQEVLTPEYLAQEIPGAAALIGQVNAYKRSVEGSKRDTSVLDVTEGETTNNASSKHQKVSTSEEQDKNSNLGQGLSTYSTTYALVDGRPWYDSRPPHTHQSRIKPVPGIDPLPKLVKPRKSKRKGAAKSLTNGSTNILEQYTEKLDISSEMSDETCIICCESLSAGSSYDDDTTISKLRLCSHVFHKSCLEAMYNSGNKEFLQCPSCKQIHGDKCGTQPLGEMIYHVLPYSLPGYPENDTIRIIYDIHSGIQGPEHPNPGKRYTARGFPRHCYLPDNEMGRKILRLLVKAWKRRLIFTVGQSSTTGEENTVTWNEIHHKTEFGCNRRGHGYPDENYFSNVLAELEAHGIKDDEVRVWYPA